MHPVIQVSHLSKQFGQVRAVDDLSFTVQEGEVYGFLGQNGAGKSTTIRMLLTLVSPSAGSIQLFGHDLHTHRADILRQTGAVIEKPDLYKYLSAYDNLELFARLSGLRPKRGRLMDQLAMVGLEGRAHSKVKTYSQGMKQRLGIAVALVHDPRLILLDEPTNGLDPQGIADIRNLVIRLSREFGKTVFVSSHLLNEIEQVSDRLLILDKGKKVVESDIASLIDPANTFIQLQTSNNNACFDVLLRSGWAAYEPARENGHIALRLPMQKIPELVSFLVQQGVQVYALGQRNSLETYFLSLIGSK